MRIHSFAAQLLDEFLVRKGSLGFNFPGRILILSDVFADSVPDLLVPDF